MLADEPGPDERGLPPHLGRAGHQRDLLAVPQRAQVRRGLTRAAPGSSMAYVVTQSCCADASCVVACPVNCIHPAPGEPGFGTTEMVYVDATTCVGCGACATACPVGAMVPDAALTTKQAALRRPQRCLLRRLPARGPHAARAGAAAAPAHPHRPVPGRGDRRRTGRPLHGRRACSSTPRSRVSTSTTGCARRTGWCGTGSPPTMPPPRLVTRLFEAIERQPRFRYFLGTEVGTSITLADLRERYHAVVYAVGASADRALGIPGEESRRLGAGDGAGGLVQRPPRAAGARRAADPRAGRRGRQRQRRPRRGPDPDPRPHRAGAHRPGARPAGASLRGSSVREVVVLGRRGPAQAAFTVPEPDRPRGARRRRRARGVRPGAADRRGPAQPGCCATSPRARPPATRSGAGSCSPSPSPPSRCSAPTAG
ncbi:4Fe-4S binding protein [Nocardioides convexus]|uniref:4Fe-4S binding protein n=1 Tax=Nocardioides convexus TaxID=2712224 RepID=UPI0024187AC1|nr:4Fe-4S binding protein [Nocardioides convexus]